MNCDRASQRRHYNEGNDMQIKLIALFTVAVFGAILIVDAKSEASDKASPKPRIEVCFVLDTTGSMGID